MTDLYSGTRNKFLSMFSRGILFHKPEGTCLTTTHCHLLFSTWFQLVNLWTPVTNEVDHTSLVSACPSYRRLAARI